VRTGTLKEPPGAGTLALGLGDEQGRDSFDASDLLPLFCGFAADAVAIASMAERLALISARSKRLVHEWVTCAHAGSA
jgi:hypothetical protein